MTKPHLENFFLPGSFLDSMAPNEVHETFTAMRECDIARAPFEEFCITVPEDKVIRIVGEGVREQIRPEDTLEFHYANVKGNLGDLDSSEAISCRCISWHGKRSLDYFVASEKAEANGDITAEQGQSLRGGLTKITIGLLQLLVVALATKGVQKVRERNKLAALGIGAKRRGGNHAYTTTISVGHVEECEGEPNHTGRTVRPHLRRGHVRTQHFGPERAFVKKIFIEPVFVNSDREYVSFRDRYNVSLSLPQKEEV